MRIPLTLAASALLLPAAIGAADVPCDALENAKANARDCVDADDPQGCFQRLLESERRKCDPCHDVPGGIDERSFRECIGAGSPPYEECRRQVVEEETRRCEDHRGRSLHSRLRALGDSQAPPFEEVVHLIRMTDRWDAYGEGIIRGFASIEDEQDVRIQLVRSACRYATAIEENVHLQSLMSWERVRVPLCALERGARGFLASVDVMKLSALLEKIAQHEDAAGELTTELHETLSPDQTQLMEDLCGEARSVPSP